MTVEYISEYRTFRIFYNNEENETIVYDHIHKIHKSPLKFEQNHIEQCIDNYLEKEIYSKKCAGCLLIAAYYEL